MRGITPARLLMALLATVTAFASAHDSSSHGHVGKDCCHKGYFCCGTSCQPLWKKEKIFCTLQVGGCCTKPHPEPRPIPLPRPHPVPWPKPDNCCRKGYFCCGDRCVKDHYAPRILCPISKKGCCRPKPPPKPDDCCPEGKFCCGGNCLDDSKMPYVRCKNEGCCKPRPPPLPVPIDQEKCCARPKHERVCCDGKCYGPHTRFFAPCKSNSCGCPDEKPKPRPKPPSDCCGRNKVCCGFKCISKWRAKYAKCAKIAGGCCLRKKEKKHRRRNRRKYKNKK